MRLNSICRLQASQLLPQPSQVWYRSSLSKQLFNRDSCSSHAFLLVRKCPVALVPHAVQVGLPRQTQHEVQPSSDFSYLYTVFPPCFHRSVPFSALFPRGQLEKQKLRGTASRGQRGLRRRLQRARCHAVFGWLRWVVAPVCGRLAAHRAQIAATVRPGGNPRFCEPRAAALTRGSLVWALTTSLAWARIASRVWRVQPFSGCSELISKIRLAINWTYICSCW